MFVSLFKACTWLSTGTPRDAETPGGLCPPSPPPPHHTAVYKSQRDFPPGLSLWIPLCPQSLCFHPPPSPLSSLHQASWEGRFSFSFHFSANSWGPKRGPETQSCDFSNLTSSEDKQARPLTLGQASATTMLCWARHLTSPGLVSLA